MPAQSDQIAPSLTVQTGISGQKNLNNIAADEWLLRQQPRPT